MKCDWPWCQNDAVLTEEGEPLLVNGMRICKRDLDAWMALYTFDATRGFLEP